MTRAGLSLRGFVHHARGHVATALCVAVAGAVLTGSLLVGDSAEQSVRSLARLRLGRVRLALEARGRTVRGALAGEISTELGLKSGAEIAPVLELSAVAGLAEGEGAPVPGVRLLGVDARFFALSGAPPDRVTRVDAPAPGDVLLGPSLAAELGARPGDEIVVRAGRPGAIPGDVPLAGEEATVALRLRVAGVVPDEVMGRFSLRASAEPARLAFVDLAWLGEATSAPGRASMLLGGEETTPAAAAAALRRRLRLDDASLLLRDLPGGGYELRSRRIFLDEAAARAAEALGGHPVFTYFVNEIRRGERSTPYSTIAAVTPAWARSAPAGDPLHAAIAGLRDGEVVLNEWLAADLGAHLGDELLLGFDVFGRAHALVPRTEKLRVRAIVPLAGAAADPRWMPDVPGLTDVDDCRDWQPGIPIRHARIRKEDEAYWKDHRGTPKAFVTLSDGERMWRSRYGDRTAVRFTAPSESREALAEKLARVIDPAAIGLAFVEIRPADAPYIDFGGLFLGFGFLLALSALLLTGLLFSLSIERRTVEIGALRAIGFRGRDVFVILSGEALAVALVGALAGLGGGLLYTRAVIAGLSTIWREAIGLPALSLHASPRALGLGFALTLAAALLGFTVMLQRSIRRPAIELLSSAGGLLSSAETTSPRAGRFARWIALGAGGVAVALVALAVAGGASRAHGGAAMIFFAAGGLLLVAAIASASALLARFARPAAATTENDQVERLGFFGLALRNAARRRARSAAVVGLLASGTFLVIGTGANRHDPSAGAELPQSGTGGFALYGESTQPITRDLDAPEAREALGLSRDLGGARVLSLRVHDGDDASCKSPDTPGAPRLYGASPEALAARGPFTFTAHAPLGAAEAGSPFRLLSRRLEGGEIPAIGDEGTVVWSLHRGLGDVVEMQDEMGRPLRLRIIGITATSILQGGLVVAESDLVAKFPGDAGYRAFLVDAAPDRAGSVRDELQSALADRGLVLVPAFRRLAAFQSVENTYISIFQSLGALGLLLGCAGTSVLVLRHVLERRAELAALLAIGFGPRRIRRLVLLEHVLLVGWGVGAGAIAAALALAPTLFSAAGALPLVGLLGALVGVTLLAATSAALAARAALAGPLTAALRDE